MLSELDLVTFNSALSQQRLDLILSYLLRAQQWLMLVEKGGCQGKKNPGSGHLASCWSPAQKEPASRTACPGVLCEL